MIEIRSTKEEIMHLTRHPDSNTIVVQSKDGKTFVADFNCSVAEKPQAKIFSALVQTLHGIALRHSVEMSFPGCLNCSIFQEWLTAEFGRMGEIAIVNVWSRDLISKNYRVPILSSGTDQQN